MVDTFDLRNIGLIDDYKKDISYIRRTIKTIAQQLGIREKYGFKNYQLVDDEKKLINQVIEEVIADIKEYNITCLIIDYKIMIETVKMEGTDILKAIQGCVPKFPLVILTGVVDESKEKDFVDADKVYTKKEFFKLEEYSKEKVGNIFDSMRKYVKQRDILSGKMREYQEKIDTDALNVEMLREIDQVERRLGEFTPVESLQNDLILDEDRLKTIVELIDKANRMCDE